MDLLESRWISEADDQWFPIYLFHYLILGKEDHCHRRSEIEFHFPHYQLLKHFSTKRHQLPWPSYGCQWLPGHSPTHSCRFRASRVAAKAQSCECRASNLSPGIAVQGCYRVDWVTIVDAGRGGRTTHWASCFLTTSGLAWLGPEQYRAGTLRSEATPASCTSSFAPDLSSASIR